MPWAWSVATACLDLETGQVLNWPFPTSDYPRNEPVLEAAHRVWRAWYLFHKPKSRPGPGKTTVSNWTGTDIDFYDWLEENAWRDDA